MHERIPITDALAIQEVDRFEDEELDVKPVVYYDVYESEGTERVGSFGLEYDYDKALATINIGLHDAATNKGYGKAIYTFVPNLPLPHGEDFKEQEFTFTSDRPSWRASRVWQSLEKSGLAIHCSDGSYQLL